VIVTAGLCLWRASTDWPNWYWFDYTGILGFGVTLLTAWIVFFVRKDVKQLSNKYSLKLALPDSHKNFEQISKKLMSFFDVNVDLSKSKPSLLKIIGDCHSLCENLNKLTENQSEEFPTTKVITFLCREISHGKQIAITDIEKLFSHLSKLIKDIELTIQNLNNEVRL